MKGSKIKVLIVDDSYFMRKILTDILSKDPRIEVMGTAEDGIEAIAKIEALNPDVVTMDINMPKLDGKQAIKKIMARHPVPVIVISAYTSKDAPLTLDCLELGAIDVVEKASGEISFDLDDSTAEIIEKIVAASKSNIAMQKSIPEMENGIKDFVKKLSKSNNKVVVIGASTGGPSTIEMIISSLDGDLKTPIVIAQHMPYVFIKNFAERLNGKYRIKVKEAMPSEKLEEGYIYICGAESDCNTLIKEKDDHLVFSCVKNTSPGKHLSPSVDELFVSAAKAVGEGLLGIVLTGMGDDGKKGVVEIKKHGGMVIAQDEESSLIYGMPDEAVKSGSVDIQLNPIEIAQVINKFGA
ncbi:hypothetical protein A2344_01720 [Candidatus Peregrinibacteria bacterium RIFOXYB12_FULL_41_12]|nr:MAG: hypothetical protein A2344_01720 [Candidatus Peregrinibacteria bacterium RIFOXYB12_FULL_41_12]